LITDWDKDKIKNDPEEQKKFIEWVEKQPKVVSNWYGKFAAGIQEICPHPSEYEANPYPIDRIFACMLCGEET